MLVLGRIAAGESGVDVVKVLECEDVMRARVAGDYRVLFRYTSSVVEVLDVADRRDLQKRAKTLRAKGA
jgi:mRNA-degrading endonuclease RelE of RelBE toxin-antitoxin system